jgi:hypothetical protein
VCALAGEGDIGNNWLWCLRGRVNFDVKISYPRGKIIKEDLIEKLMGSCETHLRFSEESGHDFSIGEARRIARTILSEKNLL